MEKMGFSSDKKSNLSVVIATIGRPSLMLTLDSISNWDFPPAEVVVVLPKNSNFLLHRKDYLFDLVLLEAPGVGQVTQRIHGFRNAKYDFIMQLDDDLIIEYASYCEMKIVLDRYSDATAAPIFVDVETGECIFKAPIGFSGKVKDAITSLIVGVGRWPTKMGKVSQAGIPYGVNRESMNSDFLDVSWQSGGCILHHRKNLVLEEYYPFPGRAALEDLFHSFLLKANGLRLIVCRNATCKMESVNSISTIKSILYEYLVTARYIKFAGLPLFRLNIWLIFSIVRVLPTIALRGVCTTHFATRVGGK